MSVRDFAKTMAVDRQEQDTIKTQFSSADVSAYFEIFDDMVSLYDRGLRISERNLAGDNLIWGNISFGIWNSYKWGNGAEFSFVLGHPIAGVLGTSKLGENVSSYEVIRVVHPNRTYTENFYSEFFKQTTGTNAIWGTTGTVTLTGSATAGSLDIYKNNETITSAKLTASDSGSIFYFMSADTGSNWEMVTNGVTHTFTNTGDALRWAAVSTGGTSSISKIVVTY